MDQLNLKTNNTQFEPIEQKDIAKTDFVGFQVDGKIINELSNQVSSHLFAIGELMKNSYDAKATKIQIYLNINENILTIEDNGDGISQDNIQSLFHIAKSYKKYGEIYKFHILKKIKNNNGKLFLHKIIRNIEKKDNIITASREEVSRLVQGSKGLGLLSAFKFGNIVEWNTMSNGKSISIVANKNTIVNEDDITKVKFIINDGQKKSKGTIIKIFLDPRDEEIEFIYNFFSNKKNNEKLVNFFFDNNIEINLNLTGKAPNEKSKNVKTLQKSILNTELDENKIFNLTYDSESNIFSYQYKIGSKIKTENIPYNKKINNNDYYIKIRANAYSLKSNGKNKFSSIFKNNNNELSPLVYINGVLFNNDQLFNPSITRGIRSSESLPQITGFVEIFCTNSSLEFNNERTDLIVNSFNSQLREDIRNLNIFLQKFGKN